MKKSWMKTFQVLMKNKNKIKKQTHKPQQMPNRINTTKTIHSTSQSWQTNMKENWKQPEQNMSHSEEEDTTDG